MLYQDYRNKLAKRKRAFERVWRFRLLILAALLLMLATAAALLGVKGKVYGVTVPETVVYGEPISATASSIFGDAEFEYRAVGTKKWSREEPVYAGEYECRAVGKSCAGTNRAGSVFSFRILPLRTEVQVETISLVYGEMPEFSASLRYGDTLRVGSFIERAEEGGGSSIYVSADPLSITAINAEGEDVSSSYEFVPVEKSVNDVPRRITIQTPTAAFEYDGKPHETQIEVTGLAEGDEVTGVEVASITEAGSCANTIEEDSLRILNGSGEDVTGRYRIEYEFGTLTVTERPITVRTPSASVEYDGKEHAFGAPELAAGEFAEGQEMSFTLPTPAVNAGSYPNRPAFSVLADGRNVTRNYLITWDYGTLTVEQRMVTLSTGSLNAVYDGAAHDAPSFTEAENTLADGHTIEIGYPSFTEAATHSNAPVHWQITDESGADVSSNYDIIWAPGSIVISPRPVTYVTFGDENITYDGQPHTFGYELKEGSEVLVEGHELQTTFGVWTEVGDYENRPEFSITAEGRNVTGNYAVTWECAHVIIKPRPVAVVTGTQTWVYDAAAHRANRWAYAENYAENGFLAFAEGQILVIADEAYPALTDVAADVENRPAAFAVMAGGTPVSPDNYRIEWTYGTLTVTKRPLTVTTQNEEWTYDGTSHTGEIPAVLTYYTEDGKSDLGHRFEQTFTPHIVVAESGVKNECTVRVFAGAAEVTGNYEITYNYTGTVTIERRPVTFGTQSHEAWEYDGTPHDWKQIELRAENGSLGLAAGHEFTFSAGNAPAQKIVGQWSNEFTYEVTISDANGAVTENYAVTYSDHYGTLEILKRAVTLKTGSAEWTYDGREHAEQSYTEEKNTLAAGHTIEITYPSFKARGEHLNVPEAFTVYDEEHTAVTENYDLYFESGTLTVLARYIKFRTDSETWVYDAAAHQNTVIIPTEEGMLAPGQGIAYTITWAPSVTNFGDDRPNEIGFAPVITDETGEDVTSNYEFDVKESEWGTLAISKRPLTVTTQNEEWVYDAASHTGEIPAVLTYYTEDGKSDLGHRFEQTFTPHIVVAESGVQNECSVRVFSGADEVTGNYEITYEYTGVVTIRPRPVKVTAKTEEFDYDGKPHTYDYDTLTVEGDLAPDQFWYLENVLTAEDAKTYENNPKVFVHAAEGDVTENYALDFSAGTVTIKKLKLTITAETSTFDYDGCEHTYGLDTLDIVGDLAPGQQFRLENVLTAEDAAIYQNDPVISVYAGEKETTGNYDITYTKGVITINKLKLTIKARTETFDYDGKPHTYDSDTLSVAGNLAAGQEFRLKNVLTAEDAETYDNDPDIFIYAGEKETTGNYEIDYSAGVITINKLKLKITAKTEDLDYDGKPHTYGFDSLEIEGKLADGQEYRLENVLTAEEADIYENAPKISIYAGEKETTGNYEITYTQGTITIKKLKLTITARTEQFDYDGKPHTYGLDTLDIVGELAEGQEYRLGNVLTAEDAAIYVNDPDISIYAGEKETTGNYDITYTKGTVTIDKLKLTITARTEQFNYDGKPHTYDHDTLSVAGKLAPDQYFHLEKVLTAEDAGTYDNDPDIFIRASAEKDTTKNYEIAYTPGTITIDKLKLTITAKTEQFDYDGKPHTYDSDTLDIVGDLAPDQYFYLENVLTAEDAGFYDNDPHIFVRAAGDKDTTKNYEIDYTKGTVTIDRLVITVTTKGETFVYDGRTHTYADLTLSSGSMAENQRLVREESSVLTMKNVETRLNEATYHIWDDAGSREIDKKNYEITEEFGTVEIQKYKLVLSTVSETFVYDGLLHTYDDNSIRTILFEEGCYEKNLAAEEKFVLTGYLEVKDANEKGYLNKPEGVDIKDGAGESTLGNYEITWQGYGTVIIQKYKLVLSTVTETFVYDGRTHTYDNESIPTMVFEEGSYQNRLAAEEKFVLTNYLAEKNANEEGYPNRPDFDIVDAAGNSTLSNYDISPVTYGTVTIQRRPLTVTTRDHTWVYDGASHTGEGDYEIVYYEGDTIGQRVELTFTPYTEVKESGNKVECTVLVYDGETPVTENYIITLQCEGTVTVTPRPLRLTTVTESFYYDGTLHLYTDLSFDMGYEIGIASGQKIERTNRVEAQAAGGYPNRATYLISWENGDFVDVENYEITEEFGTVTIEKRPVTFGTQSETWIFDGAPHSLEAIELRGGAGLAAGQEFSFRSTSAPPSVTAYTGEAVANEFTYEVTITAEGEDVTSNYDITYSSDWGELRIVNRELHLRTKDGTWEYDGAPHSMPEYEADGLLEGHSLQASYMTVTDVTSFPNIPQAWKIVDESGENVTANYKITWDGYGTLHVTPRIVTIRTLDGEWTYDAAPHSQEGYAAVGEKDLVAGHSLVLVYRSELKAGVYLNIPNMTSEGGQGNDWTILGNGREISKDNYQITWEYGSLTIHERPLTVTTADMEWVYDGTSHVGEREATVLYYEGNDLGHRVEITLIPHIAAGEYTNDFTFEVYDGEGEIVTTNYILSPECKRGTINILKREVHLVTVSDEFYYDGKEHKYDGIDHAALGYAIGTPYELVEGQSFVLDSYLTAKNFVEGGYANRPTVGVMDGGSIRTDGNYDLRFEYGTVLVKKRPLTVITPDCKWTYDGASHTKEYVPDIVYYEDQTLGHEVLVTFTERTERGSYPNRCDAVEIFDEYGAPVTENYEIALQETGTVTIEARHIKIRTASALWVYEQEAAAAGYFTADFEPLSELSLVAGQFFSPETTVLYDVTDSASEALFVPNEWKSFRILDGGGIERTSNYEVETEWGMLRVKLPVIVQLYSLQKTYDGKPLAFEEGDWFVIQLPVDVTEDEVEVTLRGEITRPGRLTANEVRMQSSCSVQGVNVDDPAGKENRVDFVCENAALIVKKIHIVLSTVSIVGVRDAENPTPLLGTDAEHPYLITYGALLTGHRIAEGSVIVTGILDPEADEAENTLNISGIRILDAEGNDVTEYYEFEVKCGTLSWATE